MNGAFYIGAAGLNAQERALETSANNIANLNTPGYKRAEVRFQELVGPRPSVEDAALNPSAVAQLGGVNATAPRRIFAQGELRTTGRALDLAIDGEGFLELFGPGGEALLWRGGSLKVDAEGNLASASGLPLKAMIAVPPGATGLTIGREGTVRAMMPGEASPTELGRIEIVRVADPGALEGLDDGLYRANASTDIIARAPGEEGAGVLVQGAIEGSNVAMSEEMVTLMLMQRAYAANAQVVQAGDQLAGIANGLRRG